MYAGDSFFILPGVGQAGLAILSALLGLAAGACVLAVEGFAWRMAAALAVFWVFLWLTPQIYYLYYQIILDDLPWQIIVGLPPSPDALIDRFLFRGPATLSNHAKGVLGWALIGLGPLAFAVKKVTKSK
ncbi:MAG: hypothetical protein IIB67_11770 [Proteobacteria bacterium]|nr:hypothetical protein [Pseudomonadota bacterium]